MSFFGRWKWYQSTIKNRASQLNSKDQASLDAELRALRHVESLECVKSAQHAIRIPDPQRRLGAGEIDVLALTDRGFCLIEVKNWSQKIEFVDGDVVQIRRKGRQLSPVLPHLGAKLSNLKRCAVSLIQDDALEAAKIVLFTNPNADLSKDVRAHPEVATFNNITEKLDSSLQHFEKLSSEAMNNYEALSSSFATWDQIKFDGGNISCGDFDDSMMPKKWARKDFQRISIKVSRGLFKTILFGPQLEITLETWDGEIKTEIMDSLVEIKFSSPWKKGGVNGDGKYPAEHLSEILHGFRHDPFSNESLDKLPKPKPLSNQSKHHGNSMARIHGDNSIDYKERFRHGTEHKGTVIKKLIGDKGVPYAYLVALIERRVTGLLPFKELDSIHPDLLDMMYANGRPIEVCIKSYSGPRKIKLQLTKEVKI
jgi:hypothetical protein